MKFFFKLLLCKVFILAAITSLAQNEKNLSELVTPSAPAFTILGIQPSDISRPKSFGALEGTLLSSFTGSSDFIIPRNYALEFSPYWFNSHPTLTFDQYVQPSVGQSLLQNLSFSLATTTVKNNADTGKNFSRMGLGIRTQLFSGKATDYMKNVMMTAQLLQNKQKVLVGLKSMIFNINDTLDPEKLITAIDKEFDNLLTSLPDSSTRNAFICFKKQRFDGFLANAIKKNSNKEGKMTSYKNIKSELISDIESIANEDNFLKSVKNLSDSIKSKYGFFMEINGALSIDFPTNQIGNSIVPKWGVWVIPSYRLKKLHFEFIGILRYIGSHDTGQVNHNFDVGAKVVYQAKKFSINAEGLYRYQTSLISRNKVGDVVTKSTKVKSDYRVDLSFEYKITEMISVNYTLGRNFDDPITGPGTLISSVGLNFGLNGLKVPNLSN